MAITIAKDICSGYKYLIVINCITTKEWDTKYIPSFITNKLTNYLVKTKEDVCEFIREIFMVWRFNFHSDSNEKIRTMNKDYMELIIDQINNSRFFPYLEYMINSGINSGIYCSIKIYPMRNEFINLLDLIYESGKIESKLENNYYKYNIFSYIVFKDSNPKRLQIFIKNPKNITSEIDQTFLKLDKIHDFDFYQVNFKKLGLTLVNTERFIKLLNSGASFLLTKDDFISEKEIIYSNIYCLSKIDERVTTIEQEIHYLKMDYLLLNLDKNCNVKVLHDGITRKIMSFL
jgi:hypothetical protein